MRKSLLILAPALLLPVFGGDPIAPETLLLARIQSKAKLGLANVPAYTCSEIMERSDRRSSHSIFHRLDQVKLEVAEIGGRELFSRPGEASFRDMATKELAGQGLVATGMFYHMAHTVFATPVAHFEFAGRKRIKGRPSVQYSLAVSPLFANYHLHFNYHEANCGFRGAFWVDNTSLDLIRLRIEATDVPPELLLRSAVTEIDYSRASFDGKSFLIPSSADIQIVFQDGRESRNQVHFSNCRKYGVESIVTFQ